MRKFHVILCMATFLVIQSCSSAYDVVKTPVDHNFSTLDGPNSITDIVPTFFKLASSESDVNILKMISKTKEEKYFSNFFEDFENTYEVKNLRKNNGQISIIYTNKGCDGDKTECAQHVIVSYGPPRDIISSCKIERTHKETGEKSVYYHSLGFPFFVNYQLKGETDIESYFTLLYIEANDFEKYSEFIRKVKSIYSAYNVECELSH